MSKRLIIQLLLLFLLGAAVVPFARPINSTPNPNSEKIAKQTPPSPSPIPLLQTPPEKKILENNYHIFQTFNNCGPASLSMALSYFNISESQEKLGEELRPYQHPQGIHDDKSVTLEELAKKAQEYNLLAYHRPNGNMKLLKQFISQNMPVITRTWISLSEDIGHYRVIKGYNDADSTILQDDSYQGKNLTFSYADFDLMWEKFNYEYLLLVPKEKKYIAEAILGENLNTHTAWKQAIQKNEAALKQNSSDTYKRFNLSIAYYHIGNYKKAVEEFEKIENQLPFRTLWYQIEPIQAYAALGNHDKVFSLTEAIFYNGNAAFSELYLIRGKIYEKQGDMQAAKAEYEKAVFYNRNLEEAKKALMALK